MLEQNFSSTIFETLLIYIVEVSHHLVSRKPETGKTQIDDFPKNFPIRGVHKLVFVAPASTPIRTQLQPAVTGRSSCHEIAHHPRGCHHSAVAVLFRSSDLKAAVPPSCRSPATGGTLHSFPSAT
jgi:hypothetical protein